MLKKVIVEIIVAFFPKSKRAELRYILRNYGNFLYVKHTAQKLGKNFRCGENILITKNTIIGNDVTINGIQVQGHGELFIGNHCVIGSELLAITSTHEYESDRLPFGKEYRNKPVVIGDCCWLGSRVTLLPGTELAEGCIVQAGAVVHGKFPAGSIIGGNPAIAFKSRDMENYNRNKENHSYK